MELYYLKKIGTSKGEGITPLNKNTISVGRKEHSDLLIPDLSVSRHHATIFKKENHWIIKNCSTSGLFVNDSPVLQNNQIVLTLKSKIQFGPMPAHTYQFLCKYIADTTSMPSVSNVLKATQNKSAQIGQKDSSTEDNLREMQSLQLQKFEAAEKSLKVKLQELEEKYEKDVVAQKKHLKEKEELNENYKLKMVQIEQQLAKEKQELEAKLKEEAEVKENVLEENQLLTAAMQAEKEALTKIHEEQLNKLRLELQKERDYLAQQVSAMQQRESDLRKSLEDNESKLAHQLQARVELEKKHELDEGLLQCHLKEIQDREIEISNSIKQKEMLSNQLASLVQEKEKSDTKLQGLVAENSRMEEKLKKASTVTEEVSGKQVVENITNAIEDEFQCVICSEVLVKTIVLNCSHSFCEYCIDKWIKQKRECPTCRTPISSKVRSIGVDNFIEKMMETLPVEMKCRRVEVIKEREEAVRAKAEEARREEEMRQRNQNNRGNRRGRGRGGRNRGRGSRGRGRQREEIPPFYPAIDPLNPMGYDPYEIPYVSSTPGLNPDEYPEVPMENTYTDSESYSDSYSSSRGSSSEPGDPDAYYGGYGRCYNCGSRGHWANRCPY